MLVALTLLLMNAIGAVGILKWGQAEERVIIGLMAIYVFTTPWLEAFELQTMRVGVFAAEVLLFAVLFWCTGRVSRWWLIAAGGAQLIAVLSHLMPFVMSDMYIWTGVSLRRYAWTMISISVLWGVWENWAHHVISGRGPTLSSAR